MIKDLSSKLKTFRLKYGYSQKQVAQRLGVSPSIVSGYETGERTPSTENLLALSYLYNCSSDYLLGRKDDSQRLVLSTDGLTDKQIAVISELIEVMKNK